MRIRDFLKNYNKQHGFGTSAKELWKTLTTRGNEIHREQFSRGFDGSRDRSYMTYFCVVELDGMKIGFYNAESECDLSPSDMGWDFELDCCREVEERKITTIEYRMPLA